MALVSGQWWKKEQCYYESVYCISESLTCYKQKANSCYKYCESCYNEVAVYYTRDLYILQLNNTMVNSMNMVLRQ